MFPDEKIWMHLHVSILTITGAMWVFLVSCQLSQEPGPIDEYSKRPAQNVYVLENDGICVLNEDGYVACTLGAEIDYVPVEFKSVVIEREHICGVQIDDQIHCAGNDALGQSTPPNGKFTMLDSSGDVACGVTIDGKITCWGEPSVPKRVAGINQPPTGQFKTLSLNPMWAGNRNGCAIALDETLTCWGSEKSGINSVPAGEFQMVDVASDMACGITVGYDFICWGQGVSFEQTMGVTPYDGKLKTVDTSGDYTCGVLLDDTLRCWGYHGFSDDINVLANPTVPAAGRFRSVTVGAYEACGIRMTGTVVCW